MVRVLLCLLLAAAAPAQTEKHPELGMTFTGPGGYERLPVRPRERFGALSYVDRAGAAERPATLDVFVVPRGGDVANARAFVEDVLRGAAVEVLRVGRSRYGYEPARFAFEVTEDGSTVAGWAHAWEGPARSYLVVGRCEPGELAAQRSSWTRSAEDLRLFEPTDGSAERRKWERYYGGRRGLTGVEPVRAGGAPRRGPRVARLRDEPPRPDLRPRRGRWDLAGGRPVRRAPGGSVERLPLCLRRAGHRGGAGRGRGLPDRLRGLRLPLPSL